MIKDFLIISCTGNNDKIGLKINTNFFIHDFQSKINNEKISKSIFERRFKVQKVKNRVPPVLKGLVDDNL